MELSEFAKVAIKAVKEAEKVILHYFKPEIKFGLKKDLSPVTIADKKAEEIIIKTIKNSFPNHKILGEETGKNRSISKYTWVIDPIDGTKNYIRQIPFFATELALMRNRQVVLGVSNAPLLNELLIAERNRGTYFNGQRIRVSKVNLLKRAYMNFGGINHFQKEGKLKNLMNLVNRCERNRGFGDFYGYHLVARGLTELMVEAKIKFWDIASFIPIIEEAGGRITDFEGSVPSEKTTSIIASNGKVHEEVLKIMTGSF